MRRRQYYSEEQIPTGFDFNLVTIENVSEPTEEGQRTIVLNFKDKEGNALKLTALSWYCHLETGKYEIAPEPDSKHKASVELSLGNEKLNVKGGSIAVSKWNYEYDFKFTIETEKGSSQESQTTRRYISRPSNIVRLKLELTKSIRRTSLSKAT